MLCHLPSCRASGVCPLGEVGDGSDHPIVDLCQCQPPLGGALDRLGKHILVRFQVKKMFSRKNNFSVPDMTQYL